MKLAVLQQSWAQVAFLWQTEATRQCVWEDFGGKEWK